MKYIFIVIVTVANFFGFAQNFKSGEVIYNISFNKQLTTSTKSSFFKNIDDVKYKLIFNSNKSEYKKIESMSNDANKRINLTEIEAGGKNVFYFNSDKKENIYTKKLYGEVFLIKQNVFKWKLTKESKIIDGYNCYKAILKDANDNITNIFAWYTLEIPLNYGPKNFNGLPGLILQLNSKKGIYIAKKVTFSEEDIKINPPTNGNVLAYKEFKKRFGEIFKKN